MLMRDALLYGENDLPGLSTQLTNAVNRLASSLEGLTDGGLRGRVDGNNHTNTAAH
jgi:hypothetical protein